MTPLLNAIYSLFTSSSALTTAFPGGLHRDNAPEGTAMPYLVSKVVSSKTELTYGLTSRTVTQVKLSAFGIGHDATGTLAEIVVGVFNGATLAIAGGTNDAVVPLGDPTPALLSHDGQGNDVWEWSVVYEFGVVSFS